MQGSVGCDNNRTPVKIQGYDNLVFVGDVANYLHTLSLSIYGRNMIFRSCYYRKKETALELKQNFTINCLCALGQKQLFFANSVEDHWEKRVTLIRFVYCAVL
jgi:hypothetical protein